MGGVWLCHNRRELLLIVLRALDLRSQEPWVVTPLFWSGDGGGSCCCAQPSLPLSDLESQLLHVVAAAVAPSPSLRQLPGEISQTSPFLCCQSPASHIRPFLWLLSFTPASSEHGRKHPHAIYLRGPSTRQAVAARNSTFKTLVGYPLFEPSLRYICCHMLACYCICQSLLMCSETPRAVVGITLCFFGSNEIVQRGRQCREQRSPRII